MSIKLHHKYALKGYPYECLFLTYHKGQKLSKRKDLQFTGFHPNVGKSFAVFALAAWNVLKKATA